MCDNVRLLSVNGTYVYFVYHCHLYIFLNSMKSFLLLVCVLFYEFSVHFQYTTYTVTVLCLFFTAEQNGIQWEACTLECQETLWSIFSFANWNSRCSTPEEFLPVHAGIMLITSGAIALASMAREYTAWVFNLAEYGVYYCSACACKQRLKAWVTWQSDYIHVHRNQ